MLQFYFLSLICFYAQSALVSPMLTGCLDPTVVNASEVALDQNNAARKEGYIFSLNRVHDVHQETMMAVLETMCHVISKSEIRKPEDVPVFGTYDVSVSIQTDITIQSFNCTIQEVPGMAIISVCEDCPISVMILTEVRYGTADTYIDVECSVDDVDRASDSQISSQNSESPSGLVHVLPPPALSMPSRISPIAINCPGQRNHLYLRGMDL